MAKKERDFLAFRAGHTLGDLERYVADGDDMLSQYYVGRELFLARALSRDDPTSVFIGPKGVGKSAILQMVRLQEEASGDSARVIEIAPDDLAFNALVNVHNRTPLLQSPGDNRWLFKSLWDYVLCVAILEKEHGDRDAIEKALKSWFGDRHEKEQKQLLRAALDDSGTKRSMTEKMLSLVEEIEVQGSFAGNGGAVRMKTRDSGSEIPRGGDLNTLQLINNVAKQLPSRLKHEYYVLVDDLDLNWKGTDLQNAFLGSLFLSLRKLSHDRRIKFVVSLRKRIFRSVDIEERDKFAHMVCEVDWTQQQLKEMAELRLCVSLSLHPHEVWDNLFPENAFRTILGNTNGMPREIIRLAVACVKKSKQLGHLRISEEDLEAALRAFSEERIDDYCSDNLTVLPDIRAVVQQFHGGKKEFDLEYVREIAYRAASRIKQDEQRNGWIFAGLDSPVDFARRLLMSGFLMAKQGRHGEARVVAEHELELVDEQNWFAIHPMYVAALQIEGKS